MPLMVNVGIEFTIRHYVDLRVRHHAVYLGIERLRRWYIISTQQAEGKGHAAYLIKFACPGCMTGYWVRKVEQSDRPALINLL